MNVVDLTLPIPARQMWQESWQGEECEVETVRAKTWDIAQGPCRYQAQVYLLNLVGMSGTYIDFPGHIVATDDGTHAGNAPLENLYRVAATVIRLDRADGSGGISADALRRAAPEPVAGGALVLNALGRRRFDEVGFRSVYLLADAVAWIVASGVRLLVSDVFESDREPQNVFQCLFAGGIATVCQPVNLHRIADPHPRITALPLVVSGVTQLPCRVIAEWK